MKYANFQSPLGRNHVASKKRTDKPMKTRLASFFCLTILDVSLNNPAFSAQEQGSDLRNVGDSIS